MPNKGDGKQRHRLALSDGQNWITAVPATQLDDLVASKAVDVGSVIRLQEYLFNHVNSRQCVPSSCPAEHQYYHSLPVVACLVAIPSVASLVCLQIACSVVSAPCINSAALCHLIIACPRRVVILLQLDNLGRLDKLAECTEVNKGQNAANTSNAGPPLLGGAGPGPYAAINGERNFCAAHLPGKPLTSKQICASCKFRMLAASLKLVIGPVPQCGLHVPP